jgi:hypothetical protein
MDSFSSLPQPPSPLHRKQAQFLALMSSELYSQPLTSLFTDSLPHLKSLFLSPSGMDMSLSGYFEAYLKQKVGEEFDETKDYKEMYEQISMGNMLMRG